MKAVWTAWWWREGRAAWLSLAFKLWYTAATLIITHFVTPTDTLVDWCCSAAPGTRLTPLNNCTLQVYSVHPVISTLNSFHCYTTIRNASEPTSIIVFVCLCVVFFSITVFIVLNVNTHYPTPLPLWAAQLCCPSSLSVTLQLLGLWAAGSATRMRNRHTERPFSQPWLDTAVAMVTEDLRCAEMQRVTWCFSGVFSRGRQGEKCLENEFCTRGGFWTRLIFFLPHSHG